MRDIYQIIKKPLITEKANLLKEKANKVHAQITEMREKLMAIRRDQREKRNEAMKIVRAQNEQVKATLENQEALKDYEEKALEQLLKKGKFSK